MKEARKKQKAIDLGKEYVPSSDDDNNGDEQDIKEIDEPDVDMEPHDAVDAAGEEAASALVPASPPRE